MSNHDGRHRLRIAAEGLHDEASIMHLDQHGVTRQGITDDFSRKLTHLDDAEVSMMGHAVSLNDPRDIAMTILGLAGQLVAAGPSEIVANAIGAQCIAYRLARARVEMLDITAGDDVA